jgi:hypothetical protein
VGEDLALTMPNMAGKDIQIWGGKKREVTKWAEGGEQCFGTKFVYFKIRERLGDTNHCAIFCQTADIKVGGFYATSWHFSNARRLAILSVACCCCSLSFALVCLPIMLSSMQSLHSEVQLDTDFCRLRLRDFWTEMSAGDGYSGDMASAEGGEEENMQQIREKRVSRNL